MLLDLAVPTAGAASVLTPDAPVVQGSQRLRWRAMGCDPVRCSTTLADWRNAERAYVFATARIVVAGRSSGAACRSKAPIGGARLLGALRRIMLRSRSEHALCSPCRPGRSRLRTGSPCSGVWLTALRRGAGNPRIGMDSAEAGALRPWISG